MTLAVDVIGRNSEIGLVEKKQYLQSLCIPAQPSSISTKESLCYKVSTKIYLGHTQTLDTEISNKKLSKQLKISRLLFTQLIYLPVSICFNCMPTCILRIQEIYENNCTRHKQNHTDRRHLFIIIVV